MNSVLHVGMPKCGSSALQTALSLHPSLKGKGSGRAEYVALLARGRVLSGAALTARAGFAPSGYVLSTRAAFLASLDGVRLNRMRAALDQLRSGGARLLLSNEGWAREHRAFAESRILERLGLQSTVVLYVRPQAGYCNAAWWQWGAWTRAPMPRWVRKQLPLLHWSDVVDGWRDVPGVSEVKVRLLPPAIVGDYCRLLGLEPIEEVVANPGLPPSVLRLFQQHRELRQGAHDSDIEFILGRHLALQPAGSPWVLNQALVGEIIEACREGNLRLCEQLDPSQRAAMRADAAWWSAEHYAARTVEPWQPRALPAAEAERLATAAFLALSRLDERYRRLAEELHDEREAARLARDGKTPAWPFKLPKFRAGQ